MTAPSPTTVDAYLDAQSELPRRILRRVRTIITRAVPGLEPTISYEIPTFELGGRAVLYFAAWKAHFSLYPASAAVFEAVPELLAYRHAKDTVRLAYDAPLPVHLIARFAEARAREVANTVKGKAVKAEKKATPKKATPKKAVAKTARKAMAKRTVAKTAGTKRAVAKG